MRGRRGWLRPLILSLLLNKGPLNGVEIMDRRPLEAVAGQRLPHAGGDA